MIKVLKTWFAVVIGLILMILAVVLPYQAEAATRCTIAAGIARRNGVSSTEAREVLNEIERSLGPRASTSDGVRLFRNIDRWHIERIRRPERADPGLFFGNACKIILLEIHISQRTDRSSAIRSDQIGQTVIGAVFGKSSTRVSARASQQDSVTRINLLATARFVDIFTASSILSKPVEVSDEIRRSGSLSVSVRSLGSYSNHYHAVSEVRIELLRDAARQIVASMR